MEAFEVYINWAYEQKLDMAFMSELPDLHNPPSYMNLGLVWQLGSYLQNDDFCNAVIDRVLEKREVHKGSIGHTTLRRLWEILPPQSGMRRLVRDITISVSSAKRLNRAIFDVPYDLLLDIARYHAEGREEYLPTYAERCTYHTHASGDKTCT